MDQIVLLLLASAGFYFLYQGVYALRYQQRYQRNWLSGWLLRRTPPPMEKGMIRVHGVLRMIYGIVLLGMTLYFWRVAG